jgi:BirA family biotin operon repressor/biotin-[acetyl-CoA-carboxylase] ligase
LKIEAGESFSRPALAVAILQELDEEYTRICAGKFSEISDEWEEHCGTIGKDVTVRIGDRVIQGRAESLDDEGALVLRTEHGRLQRITGGDVTIEK